jgi:hypothetical protein
MRTVSQVVAKPGRQNCALAPRKAAVTSASRSSARPVCRGKAEKEGHSAHHELEDARKRQHPKNSHVESRRSGDGCTAVAMPVGARPDRIRKRARESVRGCRDGRDEAPVVPRWAVSR